MNATAGGMKKGKEKGRKRTTGRRRSASLFAFEDKRDKREKERERHKATEGRKIKG